MTLRKVPGALVLGLLASLAAHTAVYGGEHAMAGGYHQQFDLTALIGALSLLVGFAALAWNAGGKFADGSILAARLGERLPGFGSVLGAAALWFALAEAIEPSHASVPAAVIAFCLLAAAWIIGAVARFVLAALARVIVAVCRLAFASRTPQWTRRPAPAPLRRDVLCVRRRFTRPPPVPSLHRA